MSRHQETTFKMSQTNACEMIYLLNVRLSVFFSSLQRPCLRYARIFFTSVFFSFVFAHRLSIGACLTFLLHYRFYGFCWPSCRAVNLSTIDCDAFNLEINCHWSIRKLSYQRFRCVVSTKQKRNQKREMHIKEIAQQEVHTKRERKNKKQLSNAKRWMTAMRDKN